MRDFGRIRSVLWEDDKVRSLSPDSLITFQYLLTCRHTNALGFFRLPMGYVVLDLNPWLSSAGRVSKAFAELTQKGLVVYCEASQHVLILNFIRHNQPENPKVGTHLVKLCVDLFKVNGNAPLARQLVANIKADPPKHLNGFIPDI